MGYNTPAMPRARVNRPDAVASAPLARLPVVAIVGRPNVGKSTLFNRLLQDRRAIVAGEPGTTRDRSYGEVEWRQRRFTVIDTGGVVDRPATDIERHVQEQVQLALAEADLVLFLVDARDGLTLPDAEVARSLERSRRPVVLVVNKAEGKAQRQAPLEFLELGLGEPLLISAYHGEGVAELLDHLLTLLPPQEETAPQELFLKIAILGRPNVGKSLLLNTILGQERSIVSEVPGTTRDAIDIVLERDGERILLIDTAGIRRRGRVEPGVERFSVLRAQQALDRCDVAILVLEAPELISAQDTHLAGAIAEAGKGLVLAVNKWDLAPGAELREEEALQTVRGRLRFAPYAPLVFVSALKGTNIDALLIAARRVFDERQHRVETGELNRALATAVARHAPPPVGTRRLKLLYGTQVAVNPPTFAIFVNDPAAVHFSFRRYLENQLREAFGFRGTPIRLVFRGRREREARRAAPGSTPIAAEARPPRAP